MKTLDTTDIKSVAISLYAKIVSEERNMTTLNVGVLFVDGAEVNSIPNILHCLGNNNQKVLIQFKMDFKDITPVMYAAISGSHQNQKANIFYRTLNLCGRPTDNLASNHELSIRIVGDFPRGQAHETNRAILHFNGLRHGPYIAIRPRIIDTYQYLELEDIPFHVLNEIHMALSTCSRCVVEVVPM